VTEPASHRTLKSVSEQKPGPPTRPAPHCFGKDGLEHFATSAGPFSWKGPARAALACRKTRKGAFPAPLHLL